MKPTEKNRYRNGWSRKIALRPVKVLLISLIFAAPFASGSKGKYVQGRYNTYVSVKNNPII